MVCMEGNTLKMHRANPKANSCRMKEAVMLALWDMYHRISDEKGDINDFDLRSMRSCIRTFRISYRIHRLNSIKQYRKELQDTAG